MKSSSNGCVFLRTLRCSGCWLYACKSSVDLWSVKLSEINPLTSFIMVSTLVESASGLTLRRTMCSTI
ncbi:hypothetical protein HanXRQr2_Chr12g0522011 [Helianthus annuus]|uniref:Uncharacterized protein n=1 Tax=Helianthus annuus TaxID=4232 RepID=A0A9K3EMW7_HELAN|nr:hypothetical protein HanXRQr2_Chr12g0522011 [Helianthus annuus]KAJ0861121.1 hypothetical protein HanPSC8_Chr12g0503141 [Helianthus annuus]